MATKKKAKKTETDQDIIAEALRRYKIAVEADSENDDLALDDIDFRNGDQWHEKDRIEREADNRPCLTINKLEQRVDQITGDQRMNRMGAIIRPTDTTKSYNPNFTIAQIYSGIIKNIEAVSNAKTAYDTAFDHSVGHGKGYWRIITEYSSDDSFDQDIKVKRINNSFRVKLDPAAEEVTKIDAKWGFISSLVDKEEYPGANWDVGKGEEYDLWHEEDKVRLAEYFRLVPENQILWLVNGKTIKVKDSKMDIRDELKEQGAVAEKVREVEGFCCEWFKLSFNEIFEREKFPSRYIPIIPCYGKVLNVRGRDIYRGVIRHSKDPQRIYNYARTASVEQVALAPKAPWVMEESQLGDHKKDWETANTINYSTLIYKHKMGVPPPMRQQPPQPSAGWMAESQIADNDIDASSGMYKSSLGAPSNERSGKAINARKVEGDVGTYHYHDNRSMSLWHSYTILVDMIPRIFDTNRIVRIRKFESEKGKDDEQMVEINKTITDNESGEVVKMYDLSQGKYEIVVDVGASYTTQRQQASESMMELVQYAPQIADKIMDIIARNLDWAGADEIAERLQDNRPTEQQMQQMIGEAVSKALNSEAMQIKKFEAKTKRIKTIGDILGDGDKIEVELLKILDDNGISDEEIRGHAVQIVQKMNQELMSANTAIEQQLPNPQQQPPQQGGQIQG